MDCYRETWKVHIAGVLNIAARAAGIEMHVTPEMVTAEIPPKPELGDLGFPMFSFAKLLKKPPAQIAQSVAAILMAEANISAKGGSLDMTGITAHAEGPYVNILLNRAVVAADALARILKGGDSAEGGFAFGRPGTLAGSRIMVEFSSPNTNKPLHLGHLRNDVLGESIARILAACGAEVRKVCIINDRGIHICKSMLAYQEYGQGKTPESEGVKSDHFVGGWYVRFHQIAQEKTAVPSAEERAQEMLRRWEAGDPETVELWKLMNNWTVEGMKETYRRTGISFDQYYFESQTYLKGKAEIQKGLEQGIFYRAPDGAVMVDLEAEQLDKKVLLRADGTSIYITQDIGLAIYRNQDWPFNRLIYVVGSEQQYHFQVLFSILNKLGFSWAQNLYHLSYGMVNLPDGRMKSREGTVVDADDLLDSLRDLALQEIREKAREEAVGDPVETAEKIALGALHYYLLQVSPQKDMLFNPHESLSFTGNTGPYLQYMGARISSMLRKASTEDAAKGTYHPELLVSDAEWELIKTLASYPQTVADAAALMDPSLPAAWLYELSKNFSRFYHDCPILSAETADLRVSRLTLSQAVLTVLKDALRLICVPFLETM